MASKVKLFSVASVVTLLTFSGCAPVIKMESVEGPKTRHGQFTALSSFNVRNLSYSASNQTSGHTVGEFCISSSESLGEGALQEAVDRAIRSGQEKGIEGDLIVNARISQVSKTTYKNTYEGNRKTASEIASSEVCWQVEGDLVTLDK